MYLPVSLSSGWTEGNQIVDTKALLDCGAGGTFIDRMFVKNHRFPITRLKKPVRVFNVDGTPNKEGNITHFTRLKANIGGRIRKTRFLVTGLGKEEIIFGFPWLQTENPVIDWDQGTLQWRRSDRDPIDWARIRPTQEEEKLAITEELEAEHRPLWIRAKTTASQELALKNAKNEDSRPLEERIPKPYHEYLSVFNKEAASRFPWKRPWDHQIDLKDDFIP
jgi:hypothetical protein